MDTSNMLRDRSRGISQKHARTSGWMQIGLGFFNTWRRFASIYFQLLGILDGLIFFPFLPGNINDSVRQNIPSSSPAVRHIYLIIAYPLWYLLGTMAFILRFTFITSAAMILNAFGMVHAALWVLFVPLSLFPWSNFSRCLVSRFIKPRLRRRLLDNAQVYSDIPDEPSTIRVLRLKPGRKNVKIECDLIEGPLSQMDFEALSYFWGVTLLLHTISVNGKPFFVTFNLYSALKELRYADRERLLWVDAVCINQHDETEKSTQVHMMRDIYAGASKVVVWLGKSTHTTGRVFDFVQQFGTAAAENMAALWKDHTTPPMWKNMRAEYVRVFEHEWWCRAWIVQEIVLGRRVVIQRGCFQVDWEDVYKLFTYIPFGNDEFGTYDPPLFAKNVQILREDMISIAESDITLGNLVIQFRLQSATFGCDKIYALLGLLKPDNASLITPDYRKASDDVFLEFTESCLLHMKNLDVLSLACGVHLRDISWCRDWRLNHDGLFKTRRLTSLEPHIPFSASRHHQPVFEIDLERRILSIQGHMADTVAKVVKAWGPDEETIEGIMGIVNWDWAFIFRIWWDCAREALSDTEIPAAKKSFSRTVTADCSHTEPLDWKKQIAVQQHTSKDEEAKYRIAVENACVNRRFFVTKEGRFGLGPWSMKRGDIVTILSGGTTPFILRRCTDEWDGYHRLIGEAFVDGLMYHDGSLQEDDTSRFHLK